MTTETKNLYDRLGSEVGIVALVNDIVEAHMQNPKIKARFLPYSEDPDRLDKIKGHLVTFLCAGSGGTQAYTGREMSDTHRGMNINEEEYMAATDDILNILEKHGIDEESKKDVLAITYSLKEQIMRV